VSVGSSVQFSSVTSLCTRLNSGCLHLVGQMMSLIVVHTALRRWRWAYQNVSE